LTEIDALLFDAMMAMVAMVTSEEMRSEGGGDGVVQSKENEGVKKMKKEGR
jgi:hypothetical protein